MTRPLAGGLLVAGGGRARTIFVAILLMWMVIPVLIAGNLGQDAVPYLAAGDLVRSQPHEVYASQNGDLFDLRPVFARRFCELAPEGTDCPDVNVAFVSPPQALPFALLLASLGGSAGVLVMRLLAAACLAGGMIVLWNRLARVAPNAPGILAATALLLTPFVMVPLSLAQSSPIMFLSALLGVRRTDPRGRRGDSDGTARALATSAVWVFATVLKVFPATLALILLRQRRFKLLAYAAGFLAALTALYLAIGPVSLFDEFVRTSVLLGDRSAANPYNGSVAAILYAISPSLTTGRATTILLVVELALAVGAWWFCARDADDDVQWAYGWMVSLLIVPFLWLHYLWIAIALVGLVVAARQDAARWLLALPIVAAVFVPFALLYTRGSSFAVPQAIVLLLLVGGAGWLIRRPDGSVADAAAVTSTPSI